MSYFYVETELGKSNNVIIPYKYFFMQHYFIIQVNVTVPPHHHTHTLCTYMESVFFLFLLLKWTLMDM